MDAVLYVHGKGGSAEESKHYMTLFPACDVIGLDYKGNTPWEVGEEISGAFTGMADSYDHLILIANSIGAYFALNVQISGEKATLHGVLEPPSRSNRATLSGK